ncbi:MAG: class I SAM-dependent methyltransferase [Pirellulales bacterium]|nr:class I SAM-dependent methyltransferase [Pirellulales bacterium]
MSEPYQPPDWDLIYREGCPPWEIGQPKAELIRVLDEGHIKQGTALELGCGTGADAVYLSQRGFDVTAIESSPTALERARRRGQQEDAQVHFVLDDVFTFAETSEPFDLIYDAGFYHYIRRVKLQPFLEMLWRLTKPGSYYLALAGNADERTEQGPPRVSERELRGELGRILDVVQLRPCRLESPHRPEGYLAWSCLARRPQPMT